MKILVMSFGSDAGGIEKSLLEFLKFLKSEGHAVDLYLWRKPGLLYDEITKDTNIITEKLYPGSLNCVKNLRGLIWYLRYRVDTYLKHPVSCFKQFPIDDYDIAISYCQNGYSPHYVIDKVNAKKKIMFFHHGSYDLSGRAKKIDEQHYLKYNTFVTVSDANRRMLESHFPSMGGGKILVINNICNEKRIKLMARESCDINHDGVDFVLCTVGRISPEKGQTFAIEVANELKRFGARFRWYFVGDGSDREKCEILVSKYGLNDYCSFTGMLLNPYSYIEACDIYVQTSYVEAESITIRESKILGKAIITTNLPVFEEALSDYARGCTYPFDSREIAHAIIAESKSKHLQNEVIDVSQTVNNRIFQQLRKILNC